MLYMLCCSIYDEFLFPYFQVPLKPLSDRLKVAERADQLNEFKIVTLQNEKLIHKIY